MKIEEAFAALRAGKKVENTRINKKFQLIRRVKYQGESDQEIETVYYITADGGETNTLYISLYPADILEDVWRIVLE